MQMKNSEYWKLRFSQLEEAQNNKANIAFSEIEAQYRTAQKEIEGQIDKWYRRLADNNGISLAEARQYLKGADLKEFKWDVNDYIKYGKENAINGQWVKQLENASAKFHISRFEALKIHTQQNLEVMCAKQLGTVTGAMSGLYKSGYYHTAYELQKGFGIGWDIAGLDQSQIEKVLAKPWAVDGKNFSERIWGNKQKLISEVHGELTQNIMLGADPQKAINNIAKKMNASKSNAGRLVMTEEAYFSSIAQKDCFNDLGVEQYEIVATLDSHTSDICSSLDGKHFPMKDYQPGVTAPPFHVYCRSTTVPYFDENFGDIGERAARDEETGKTYYVPEDMNYQEWKETFVDGDDKSKLKTVDSVFKKNAVGVDKSAQSGIIKESSKKSITAITDSSVERVPKVKIQGYSDEQCEVIQNQHKELLKYSRDNNENKEVAFVFDNELKNRKKFKGADDRLDFGSALYGKDLFVMHNHPRNSSYSTTDLIFFGDNINVKTFTIVKNNGNIEYITKSLDFDYFKFKLEYDRLYRKIVINETDKEKDKFVRTFLNKTKSGVIWSERKQE